MSVDQFANIASLLVNLGKWVLRFLFARLIDEEYTRDAVHRRRLVSGATELGMLHRDNAFPPIAMPPTPPPKDSYERKNEDSMMTPKATQTNSGLRPATTPGLGIAVATPHPNGIPSTNHTGPQNHLPPTAEEGTMLEKRASQGSQSRTSTDKPLDYFSTNARPKSSSEGHAGESSAPEGTSGSQADGEKEEKPKEGSSLFGKKFRMNFPKKLGGRNSMDTKHPPLDEKSEESDKSEEKEDRTIQDNLYGIIQKIRHEYDEQLRSHPSEALISGVQPSLLNDTPILRPPSYTTVIIQEEKPESGGVADLYRGTVGSVGQDTDLIEKVAPQWLGDLLLRNRLPLKDVPKVSFTLMPHEDSLPSIAGSDGNNRLNANRMLRAKKILTYVAERIEPELEESDNDVQKAEEYLDLLCHDQVRFFLCSPNNHYS